MGQQDHTGTFSDKPHADSQSQIARDSKAYPSGFRGEDRSDERFASRRHRDSDVEADETSALIASNKVEGTAVYDRNGERLGSIHNFMVDKRSGQVDYAVLTFGGFLGMGSNYYPLPWDMLDYDTNLGGYRVDLDEKRLKDAPSYSGEAPEYDETYGRSVYGYYGMPY